MKGRFSGIFKHWNQRNTEYYQQAFERLEKENKTTFNFAAAFGSTMWLVFRKMYGWAMLLTLVCAGISGILHAFCPNFTTRRISLYILTLVVFFIFGFFGNNLYYKHIKSKIAKGYTKITNYNSIDPVGGIILIGVVFSLLGGIIFGIFSARGILSKDASDLLKSIALIPFVAIPWAIDYKKFHMQESTEPVEVTDEFVNAYLEKANTKRLTMSICTMIVTYSLSFLLMMSVVSILTMKAISNR